jgi:hypothetical protein
MGIHKLIILDDAPHVVAGTLRRWWRRFDIS